MAQGNFFQFCDKYSSRAALGAVLLCALTLQGCAVAERSWDVTKSASGKAWGATKSASSSVKNFVLRSDDTDDQDDGDSGRNQQDDKIGFEYQWQIMTGDTRQIASEDLWKGRTQLQQAGLAGGAACAVVEAKRQSIDMTGSIGSANSSADLSAADFSVTQVGNLQTHRQCSPTAINSPAQLTIMTDKPLVIGAPMQGRAQVRVGDKIYDSSGLYFKFKLDSVDIDSRQVTGQFEFMGQDQADPDNRETLLVNGGRFSITL